MSEFAEYAYTYHAIIQLAGVMALLNFGVLTSAVSCKYAVRVSVVLPPAVLISVRYLKQ